MKYTKDQIELMEAKIIKLLEENGEMRFGKIAKLLIHSGMAESSFIVSIILQMDVKSIKTLRAMIYSQALKQECGDYQKVEN